MSSFFEGRVADFVHSIRERHDRLLSPAAGGVCNDASDVPVVVDPGLGTWCSRNCPSVDGEVRGRVYVNTWGRNSRELVDALAWGSDEKKKTLHAVLVANKTIRFTPRLGFTVGLYPVPGDFDFV